MQTKIIIPNSKRLQNYIEYFWLLEGNREDEPAPPIVTPEATFDIVLSFAGPTVWEGNSQRELALQGSFLSGIRKEPFTINCHSQVSYLAIRFYPKALYQFLHFPLSEIFDQVIELALLDKIFWNHLTEKIASPSDINQRLKIVEAELLTLLESERYTPSLLLEHTLPHIHATNGTLRIKDLCKQMDIYPKRLEREFKKYIGVTPKLYSQIVRFNTALNHINQHNINTQWSDLVYKLGYFDQSHFIKEFTRFLGQPPEQYQAMHLACTSTN